MDKKIYTEEELNALDREKLLTVAGEFNVEQSGRGSVIISNILEAQSKLTDTAGAEDPPKDPVVTDGSSDPSGSTPTPPEVTDDHDSDEDAEADAPEYKYLYFTVSGKTVTLGGIVVPPEVFREEIDPHLENWVGAYLGRKDL